MAFSRQEWWSAFPFPSSVDHILLKSPPLPIHLGNWACTAWLIISLSYTRLWSMWLFWWVSSDFCFHSGGHEIPGLASSGRFYLYAFVTLPGLGEFFSRDLLCPQLSPLWSPELYVLEFLLCGLHTSFCCVGVTTMGGLVGVTDPLVRLVPGLAFCRSCWLIVTRAE